MSNKKVTVGISARHVHVTREHLEILYRNHLTKNLLLMKRVSECLMDFLVLLK